MKTPLDKKIKEFEKTYGKADSHAQADKGGAADESKSRGAYEVVIAPLFFGFLGFLLDKHFDTLPIFSLILFFVGFAAGVYSAWKTMNGYGSGVGLRKKD